VNLTGISENLRFEVRGRRIFFVRQGSEESEEGAYVYGFPQAEGFVGREAMTQRLGLAMRGKPKNAKSMATR